jgi:hypothetical protein
MNVKMKIASLLILLSLSFLSFSQDWSKVKLDPVKEKKFQPYLEIRHGGHHTFMQWKSANRYEYIKEMWYFSESFYIKRNHFSEGVTLDESIIDIARFEDKRKQNEGAIIELPGFKDVIVLLPAKECFYIHK